MNGHTQRRSLRGKFHVESSKPNKWKQTRLLSGDGESVKNVNDTLVTSKLSAQRGLQLDERIWMRRHLHPRTGNQKSGDLRDRNGLRQRASCFAGGQQSSV